MQPYHLLPEEDAFSLSPVSFQSAQLNEPRKTPRKIAKVPFKAGCPWHAPHFFGAGF